MMTGGIQHTTSCGSVACAAVSPTLPNAGPSAPNSKHMLEYRTSTPEATEPTPTMRRVPTAPGTVAAPAANVCTVHCTELEYAWFRLTGVRVATLPVSVTMPVSITTSARVTSPFAGAVAVWISFRRSTWIEAPPDGLLLAMHHRPLAVAEYEVLFANAMAVPGVGLVTTNDLPAPANIWRELVRPTWPFSTREPEGIGKLLS